MTLDPGTSIDRYEIVGLIGRGAMGEVHRARDARIGRDVAIKVLPAAFSSDEERLRRFDQEVRAVGALNHPNVLAIYDVGTKDGAPYIVSELLAGATLRERMTGAALPVRKVIDYGIQVARGLAAAHGKGIVHRDLKPENLFVTDDGHIKILDFGLAKLTRSGLNEGDSLTGTMTTPGVMMGTVGYMAPEQVQGQATDHRSDIFALGCVIYEMATGTKAFHRDSPFDTLAAILRDELPPLPAAVRAQMPGLAQLLRRCVEKMPGERFESAKDLAFGLEALSGDAPSAAAAPSAPAPAAPDVVYRRVSFRRGAVWSARFTPDGHSVVYGAAWEGKPLELFWSHIGNPEARSLGLLNTDLLAISPANEIAALLRTDFVSSFDRRGVLARVPPMGGAPRELLEDVHAADWSPDGQQMAIVRVKEGMYRLEYPIGTLLHQTGGWISQMRVSRDGQRVAFIDHHNRASDSGVVCVVDRDKQLRRVTDMWGTIRGLSWSADGNEVWFTADRTGAARGIWAADLKGNLRKILQGTNNFTIHDVSRDGRVLLASGQERAGISGLAPGEDLERDLSWLDWSLMQDISADGRQILFDETAEGGGETGSVYLRPTDGSPAVRLGEGGGLAISPDGRWVLGQRVGQGALRGNMHLLPVGIGEPREVETQQLHSHTALWFPDGRRVLTAAHEPGHGLRLYEVDTTTGTHRLISPERTEPMDFALMPSGHAVAAFSHEHGHRLYDLETGDVEPITWLESNERIIRFSPDGKYAYASRLFDYPVRIVRIDVASGAREPWRELRPPDPTGIYRLARVRMSADGTAFAYSYYMLLLDLHVVEGLR